MNRYVIVAPLTERARPGAVHAPVTGHNGAIASLPFTNDLKTWTPPRKSRTCTEPNVTASVVASTLNIDTATYTLSVERNTFVFWVNPESLYVSMSGNCRM